MSQKGRIHSGSFKAKVALAAIRGEQTIPQICQLYQVHESLVHKWKKQLLEQSAQLFEDGTCVKVAEKAEKEVAALHQKIGELMVERDFLKKPGSDWDWGPEENDESLSCESEHPESVCLAGIASVGDLLYPNTESDRYLLSK